MYKNVIWNSGNLNHHKNMEYFFFIIFQNREGYWHLWKKQSTCKWSMLNLYIYLPSILEIGTHFFYKHENCFNKIQWTDKNAYSQMYCIFMLWPLREALNDFENKPVNPEILVYFPTKRKVIFARSNTRTL